MRRRWKIAALTAPAAVLFMALYFAGRPLEAALARYFAGEGYKTLPEHEGITVVYTGEEAHAILQRDALLAFFRDVGGSRFASDWGLQRPRRLTLRLFRTHEEFRQYGRLATGESLEFNGGYFDPSNMTIQLVAGDISGLRHEGMHALCHKSGAGMPRWLAEGLAQYFEPGTGGIDPASADKALFALKSGTSCVDVLGMGDAAYRGEGNDKPYAVSVAVVAAMMEGPDREAFIRFVGRRGWDDDSPYQAFAQTFGQNYNLDLTVKNYLEGIVSHGN